MNKQDLIMKKDIKNGNAPKEVIRVDDCIPGLYDQPHIHFSNSSALNKDGTWKHIKSQNIDSSSFELKFFEWVKLNSGLIKSGKLTTSGHIDDILNLKLLPKEEIKKMGFVLRDDVPAHLKMFENKKLLEESINLISHADLSILSKEQNLLLYVYLREADSANFNEVNTLNEIIKNMSYMPPEFIVTNENVGFQNKIFIDGLENTLQSFGEVFFDSEENKYYKTIVIKRHF